MGAYELDQLREMFKEIKMVLQDLIDQVAANTVVTKSAILLIQGLAAKIEELKNDPIALQKLVDDLRADDVSLGAAVVANTPAE